MSTPSFVPTPCEGCGGGGAGGADAEQNLLCDYVNGEVVGSALAVYTFDDNGNPTGPPTFVIPGTDDPYVPQGIMMACPGEVGCLEPVQFHTTTSTTGPVDHPGRQYDITLPINPGFAVQSLQVDQVTSPANIVWDVADPDGEQFRQDLTTFIEGRVPASATVTITNPNAGDVICGLAEPMQIHIECIRLDQNPPDLIELIYNGGQDMVINPAYNENPPLNPPVSQGDYGFHLLARQDDPGPFPGNPPAGRAVCTNQPNRGWETNDVGRTFEIWGRDIVQGSNVTPTPRGTPVQEITSDGPPPGGRSTIWQTFQAPATGNFVIRVVHGARDAGENHRITLDNGDTNDAQNGDLIDDVTNNVGVVTNSAGGPGPWTQFNQTIPLTAGNVYTLALSTNNPVGGARGGLFTDMRAYIDRPDLRATATTDDATCVVAVDETTTVCDDQLWSPVCDNGQITAWKNAETGQLLTNGQFWGQAPAPVPGPCPAAAAGGEGGSVAANLVQTYPVCAEVGGVATTLQRVVITDASGGVLADSFIGPDGAPVETPDSYQIGTCADTAFVNDEILCDDAGPFLRKYVQAIDPASLIGRVVGFRDFSLTGDVYSPVGNVGVCSPNQTLGAVCYQLDAVPGATRPGFMTLDSDGTPVLYDALGLVVPDGTYTIFICPPSFGTEEVLCDAGNTNHPFIRRFIFRPDNDLSSGVGGFQDYELDGSTAYAFVGPIGTCSPEIDFDSPFGVTEEVVCDLGATPITSFIRRTVVDASGAATATVNRLPDGSVYNPVGPVSLGECDECCPVVVSQDICYNDGSGLKHATSLRLADGSILIVDQATGAAVLPANVVACDAPVTARARLLAASTSWTPGADVTGTLVAVSATGVTGTFHITDAEGNLSGPYPAGYTAEWSYDPGSLTGPQIIAADAASTVAVAWTER